jgi:hypothetical protein
MGICKAAHLQDITDLDSARGVAELCPVVHADDLFQDNVVLRLALKIGF